jgi:hypothetical protein
VEREVSTPPLAHFSFYECAMIFRFDDYDDNFMIGVDFKMVCTNGCLKLVIYIWNLSLLLNKIFLYCHCERDYTEPFHEMFIAASRASKKPNVPDSLRQEFQILLMVV